ncbi:hypothetical protein A2U01_0086347, partial [Trifolium medium]|nr:hypothetical protein [Trifolium medium]
MSVSRKSAQAFMEAAPPQHSD